MKKNEAVAAQEKYLRRLILTLTCCHMASRAPSVGADMLPLSQRRPRTLLPAAEHLKGKAISLPILPRSLSNQREFGLKFDCLLINTPLQGLQDELISFAI